MAILQKSESKAFSLYTREETSPDCPAGTFVATCIDIRDEFGVTRKKYQSEETEVVDLTAFLFGYRGEDNAPYKIATRNMKISGNEKSTLFGFLRGWLGKAPQFGWDYCELKGKTCLITVETEERKSGDGEFSKIVNVSPVPAGMGRATPKAKAQPVAPPAPVPEPELADDQLPF
jgi:hypothetical protein